MSGLLNSALVEKLTAPATERNRDAILDVLQVELQRSSSVLEIGSGTGQHAIYFGKSLPHIRWQTSDRVVNHDGILAWVNSTELANVLEPLDLDVERVQTPPGSYDAVFSANTAHIMSEAAVACMFRLVGRVLEGDGVFCLYGPFNIDGNFTSQSNEQFNRSLKSQDAAMGIRDLELLQDFGKGNGLFILRQYTMPANNMLIVWKKHA